MQGAPACADGFDPDATSDVLLEDSYFATDDDAIALKAGWDCAADGPGAVPSNNITIRNISVWRGGGGLSIGSEMSGGVSNVLVEDVRLDSGSYGIQIKTGATRGGFVENVTIRRVQIYNASKNAIRLDAFYGSPNPWCGLPPKRAPPRVRNITLAHVSTARSNLSLHLHGQPDAPTTGVRLEHVTLGEAIFECLGGVVGSATDVTPVPPPACGLSLLGPSTR